jgi:ubiquitin carboxyl-terminal hydrolase 36/42
VDAEKKFTIERLPMILTIHFKRFSGNGMKKIGKEIGFEEKLDMREWLSDKTVSL